ncbi:YdcF family protein [Finegoldia magna]|uniref:YdcF family protein n=1 Tax=Finegoldia magna TaxID=1260 RepID=UPI000B916EFE|nr:YdcF family protein [Finegoldia magna]MDU1877998.1 YdcF family protein [Finegoldia magna]MDU2131786.1 YdcF family protein [Finegoldia magna]MDU4278322.1 YdcF family protein [Finegoldia magna]MDU5070544.1 YdcF family protein [Finegoldia magna]MDU6552774.1 YdcF family protein [Finegoldia magna]
MYALLLISAILLIIAATDNFISMFAATSIVLFAISTIGIIFAPRSNIILNIIIAINIITNLFILTIISYRLYQKAKVKSNIALHLTSSILYIAMIIVNLFKIFDLYKYIIGMNLYLSLMVLSHLLGNLIIKYQKIDTDFDYIVVLGGSMKGIELSELIKQRMFTSFAYYRTNKSIMIFSGGKSNGDIEESVAMKNFAVQNNIQDTDILLEKLAMNTMQNIQYVKNLIRQQDTKCDDKKVCVITNNFHAFRTKLICNKMKVNWTVVPAESNLNSKINTYLIELLAAIYLDIVLHIITLVIITILIGISL